jgi:hypothetical protein
MPNYNRMQIFSFMAQLLHPTAVVDTSYFPAPEIFWDLLVKFGSRQLVLPAIYGALRRKKLIDYAPKNFVSYLQEITDLNQMRNTAILKQINFLSEIFNRHQIEYVFLKGAAMLITKPYDALSERMVGDIDILISEKDLLMAQKLLLDEGFEAVSNEISFTKDLESEKHLERIAHSNFIAAVEIHRKLLDFTLKKPISPLKVLREKSQNPNGFYIPSKKHLWQHAILNWQYNDSGLIRNALAFRTILDVLYLEPKGFLINIKTAPSAIKHFYSLLSLFYQYNFATFYYLSKQRYKWQLKYKFFDKLNKIYFRIFFLLNIGFLRLRSKTYRKRLFNNPKLLKKRILTFWNK